MPLVAQEVKSRDGITFVPESKGPLVVHSVQGGSHGNRLILAVEAPAIGTFGSDSLLVWALPNDSASLVRGVLSAVHLNDPVAQVIPCPRRGEIVETEFNFDIPSEVDPLRKDTLSFLVIGRTGPLLRKSVVLSYTTPTTYDLDQNYPNPFNPSTTINYQLPYSSRVSLIVYDLLGRQVKTLVDEMREAGYHQAVFDASGLASGVYIYRLQATGNGTYHQVKRMLLLK